MNMDIEAKRRRRAEASRRNGKGGGRPGNITVEILPDGLVSAPTWKGGELFPCDPKPERIGGGWWMVTEPRSGRRWVFKLEKLEEGRKVSARYLPKGRRPYDVAAAEGRTWEGGATEPPNAARVESPGGPAFYPVEFHRESPGETFKALREHWEARGRDEWTRAGWPLEKERKAGGTLPELLNMARRISLDLGLEWGQVLASWIRRGRKFPHPWGAGLRAWAKERQRQEREAQAEGFEV